MGGEVVPVIAPNPVCVAGLLGMPAFRTLGNAVIERLVHIVRNGIERAGKSRNRVVRIQGIRIVSLTKSVSPRQLRSDLPRVLSVKIEFRILNGCEYENGKDFDAVAATP